MKDPKCTFCGGAHYKVSCFKAPRAAIKSKTPLRTSFRVKPVRTLKKRRQTVNHRKNLVSQLDRTFSIWIRRKDAVNDIARCVTCGFKAHWRQMQNGHYISRRKFRTRWDEMNCHVQCPNCNEVLMGNLQKYKEYLEKSYGFDATFKLQQKALSTEKIPTEELKRLIIYYKEKIDSLV